MFYLSLFFAILALVWSLSVAPEGSFRAGDMYPALEAWLLGGWFLVLHLFLCNKGVQRQKDLEQNLRSESQNRETSRSGKKTEKSFREKQLEVRGTIRRSGALFGREGAEKEFGQGVSEQQGVSNQNVSEQGAPASGSRRSLAWHCCDTLVLLFVGILLISFWHLLSQETGNIRYAANALAVWFTGPAVYFFFRLLSGAKRGKAATAILLALVFSVALAEAFFGIYAYAVRDPAFRKAYQKDPEAMLAAEGFNYPEGSPERILLEKRLLASTEPLGTYGLTNTLGGVLTPWLTVLIGFCVWILFKGYKNFITAQRGGRPALSVGIFVRMLIMLFLAIIPVSCCLILTKSRSAVLAVFFGIALFMFFYMILIRRRFPQSGRRSFLVMAIFFSAVFILGILGTALAFITGILDREVFTEAGKSLGYRLEYWTSCAAMIKDHLFWGVGPGNFQNIYPQYILPQSSEVIADPHNFVFEITALFGIPGIVLFLLLCLRAFWPVLMIKRTESGEENTGGSDRIVDSSKSREKTNSPQSGIPLESSAERFVLILPESDDSLTISNERFDGLYKIAAVGIILGGILTFLWSFFTTVPIDPFYILLFWGTSAAALFCLNYIKRRFLPNVPMAEQVMFLDLFLISAAASVLINLGAAGGIAYPAVITIVWCCVALAVNRRKCDSESILIKGQKANVQEIQDLQIEMKTEPKKVSRSKERKSEKRLEKDSFGSFSKLGQRFLGGLAVILPIIFLFIVYGEHLPALKGERFVERGRTNQISEEELNFNNLQSPEIFCARDLYSVEMAKLYYSLMLSGYVQAAELLNHGGNGEGDANGIGGHTELLPAGQRERSFYRAGYERARNYLRKITPNSASIREFLCESAWTSWRRCGDDVLLKIALEDADEMTAFFPTDAKKHFLRGQIFAGLKQSDKALLAFREALRLDELTPHADRKLNAESRKIASDFITEMSDQPARDHQIKK